MTKLERIDRIKQTIIELEGLQMCAEDLKHRAKQKIGELEWTDFASHMQTAINSVVFACEEVKKVMTQMEASK